MIFTPVVFAVFSTFSIIWYDAAIYMIPIYTLYETFALIALFMLFSDFVTPGFSTQERIQYFNNLPAPPKGKYVYTKKYVVVFGYGIVSIIIFAV